MLYLFLLVNNFIGVSGYTGSVLDFLSHQTPLLSLFLSGKIRKSIHKSWRIPSAARTKSVVFTYSLCHDSVKVRSGKHQGKNHFSIVFLAIQFRGLGLSYFFII